MLLREKLRRSHDCGLIAILHCEQRSEQRNNCLAAAYISLKHSMHLVITRHVVDDLADCFSLRLRERIRERGTQCRGKLALVLKLDSCAARPRETIRPPHQNLHE